MCCHWFAISLAEIGTVSLKLVSRNSANCRWGEGYLAGVGGMGWLGQVLALLLWFSQSCMEMQQ